MIKLTSYQEKALKLNKHIALTANAGSGKTFVLAQRFLKIILEENIPVKRIVAITFTDKAAGELYKKISKQIEIELEEKNEIDQKIEPEIKKQKHRRNKLKKIREELVSANISTIHSFCLNILKEFAPEANLDASFMPIDKETSNEILDLAVEESFNEMVNNDLLSLQIKNAVRIVGSKTSLIKQLKELVGKRRSFNKMKKDFLNVDIEEIIQHQKKLFDQYYNALYVIDETELIARIKTFNETVASENPKNIISEQVSELVERLGNEKLTKVGRLKTFSEIFIAMLKSDNAIKLRGYASKELIENNNELSEILSRQADIISNFDFENEDDLFNSYANIAKTFSVVLEFVINKYSALKREKGFIDFEDILLFTEEVLENKDVIEKLREKYSYIMIDEFQDTNEIQLNIFMPILENLHKGNLFVVGDEKQSIYMFRDAELSIFNQTKDMISTIDGSENLLNLPHSFRLSKEIAFFTNYLFSRLFANYDSSFNEVQYNELIFFDKGINSESKIEAIVSNQIKDEYDSQVEFKSQAELICGKIIELINVKKILLSQIAILCRKRVDFVLLEKELVKNNIPYSIIGGRGFYQRQLVLDLYNYLSFLINQNNDSALLSILRSPFFSLSDSELFTITFYSGNNLFEKLISASSEIKSLENIISILKEHISFVSQNRLSDLLRKIFNDTAYVAVIVKRINSRQELANIEKLFEVAQTYMNQGFRSLYDFVNYLNESIQLAEDDGQAEVSASENSIKIMTVHQSKGLEFEVVFLFNLQSTFNLTSVKSKSIDFDKEFGFITKVPQDNFFDEYKSTNTTSLFGHLIKRKEIAEQKRLLYVAVTRAANYLYLCYDDDGKVKENTFSGMLKKVFPNLISFTQTKMSGTLRRMYKDANIIKEEEIIISMDFNLSTSSQDAKLIQIKNEKSENEFKVSPNNIVDISHGEVITASQFALFMQCPVKYQLIYELGINEIAEFLPSKNNINYLEKDIQDSGTEKGTLVHNILSLSKDKIDLEKYLKSKFDFDEKTIKGSIDLVEKYYSSEVYKTLSGTGKHYNEYEVYLADEDFYLHGFIDKLIIENDKAIIADYKTDNITNKNILKKIEYYSNQLHFYAKMVFERFANLVEIEIKLIFLNDLSYSHSQIIKKNGNEINHLKKNLENFIFSIRERNYKFNKLSCGNCQFVINQKCIKEKMGLNEKNYST